MFLITANTIWLIITVSISEELELKASKANSHIISGTIDSKSEDEYNNIRSYWSRQNKKWMPEDSSFMRDLVEASYRDSIKLRPKISSGKNNFRNLRNYDVRDKRNKVVSEKTNNIDSYNDETIIYLNNNKENGKTVNRNDAKKEKYYDFYKDIEFKDDGIFVDRYFNIQSLKKVANNNMHLTFEPIIYKDYDEKANYDSYKRTRDKNRKKHNKILSRNTKKYPSLRKTYENINNNYDSFAVNKVYEINSAKENGKIFNDYDNFWEKVVNKNKPRKHPYDIVDELSSSHLSKEQTKDGVKTENRERRFLSGNIEICQTKKCDLESKPICAARFLNNVKQKKMFDGICEYIKANCKVRNPIEQYIIISNNEEDCMSPWYRAIRTILDKFSFRKNANDSKNIKITSETKEDVNDITNDTIEENKDNSDVNKRNETRKGSTNLKNNNDDETKKTHIRSDVINKTNVLRSQGRKSNNTKQTTRPCRHVCPKQCTQIYQPVCFELDRHRGRQSFYMSFLNHCYMDLYTCANAEKLKGRHLNHGALVTSSCGSYRYVVYDQSSMAMSSMASFNWLPDLKPGQRFSNI